MSLSTQNNDGTITVMDGDRERIFDYIHIIPEGDEQFSVKGYDTYPNSSVLAGQTRINFLDSGGSLEKLEALYPHASMSNRFMEPQNTFDHLPDTPDDGSLGWGSTPDDY